MTRTASNTIDYMDSPVIGNDETVTNQSQFSPLMESFPSVFVEGWYKSYLALSILAKTDLMRVPFSGGGPAPEGGLEASLRSIETSQPPW